MEVIQKTATPEPLGHLADTNNTKSPMGTRILEVQEITDMSALKKLEPHWNRLLEECERPVVYLTYEWLTTWWNCHQNPNKKLMVLVVTDGSDVIGIAPFMQIEKYYLGMHMRKIEFLSMMRYAYSPVNCSGTLDVIIPNRHIEVLSAIVTHLKSINHRWDYLRLHPIPENAPSLEALRKESLRHGFLFSQRKVFSNACIHATLSWEEYYRSRSHSFRKNLRYQANKLEHHGTRTVNNVNAQVDIKTIIQHIIDIEQRSWKATHGTSIDNERYRRFYFRFLEEAHKRGWLQLWMLAMNGKNVAYDLGIEYCGNVDILKGSYDRSYQRFSVGNLLMLREIEYFFQSGIRKINLLWGDLPYKLKWATHLEPHCEVYLFNNTLYAKLLYTIYIRSSLYRIIRFLSNMIDKTLWKIGVKEMKEVERCTT
ncbi:MAG: GNAT family N-acetyltransferase [Ignavibacteriae bacterium]|nr:GNAT family N-acetyltransferase [Ignavibacteriota bacterium]